MGCKSFGWKSGGKFNNKGGWKAKRADKKIWKKKKWAEDRRKDDDDDAGQGWKFKKAAKFDKAIKIKLACDFEPKIKVKKWKFKDDGDDCGWRKKVAIKDCDIDIQIDDKGFKPLPQVCDFPLPDEEPVTCKIDVKGCGFKFKGWGKRKKCDDDRDEPETPDQPEVCDPQPPVIPEEEEPEISDGNNAPTITAPTNPDVLIDVTSQGRVVTQVVAEDLDGDSLVFSINDATDPDSADADLFLIDSATGEISLTGIVSPMGSADGDNSYQIEVEVTDGQEVDSIVLDFVYFTSA